MGESSKLWTIAEAAQSGFEFSEVPAGLSSGVNFVCGSVAGAFESTCYLVASTAAYLFGAIVSIALDIVLCLGAVSLTFYCLLRRGDEEFLFPQGVAQESSWDGLQGMCQLVYELFESCLTYFDGDTNGLVNATRIVVN